MFPTKAEAPTQVGFYYKYIKYIFMAEILIIAILVNDQNPRQSLQMNGHPT